MLIIIIIIAIVVFFVIKSDEPFSSNAQNNMPQEYRSEEANEQAVRNITKFLDGFCRLKKNNEDFEGISFISFMPCNNVLLNIKGEARIYRLNSYENGAETFRGISNSSADEYMSIFMGTKDFHWAYSETENYKYDGREVVIETSVGTCFKNQQSATCKKVLSEISGKYSNVKIEITNYGLMLK